MLYAPGDSTALAQWIDDVAADPTCLDAYRRRLPAARARMSWSREKQKYAAILRELAGAASPPSVTHAVREVND